jgi:hypothetical protein
MCNELTALLSFMDRPFIVALVSGALLALLAHRWQTLQQRSDLQLELLRKFPLVFEVRVSLLNAWLANVLWLAEERNKPSANQVKDKIDRWLKKIDEFEKGFYNAEPLDDLLIPMEACFPSNDVANKARKLMSKWSDFENLMTTANQEYNPHQSLPAERIQSLGESRHKIVQELEISKAALLRALAKNL